MKKHYLVFCILIGVVFLDCSFLLAGMVRTSRIEKNRPKFEGVVSHIVQNEREEKTEIVFEDGKSTFFLRELNPRIVCVEVGDTLKYTGECRIHGSRCLSIRSSSPESVKMALYKQRKGVIERIEFGYLRFFKYRDASAIFTNGVVQVFSLAYDPQMACAKVGDTIVYEMKRNTARCIAIIPSKEEV